LQCPGIVVVVGAAVDVLVDEDVELVVGCLVVDVDELVVDVVVGGGAQPCTRKSTSSLWSVALFPVTIWTGSAPPPGRTIVQCPDLPLGYRW
jgi:hypothetical protein